MRLAYRLCLALGELHPDYLLARLTSAQWTGWQAYAQLEPFDEQRADLRAAIVACTVANANRKAGTPPMKIEEFMPYIKRKTQADESLSLSEKLKLAFKRFARGG